MLCSLVNYAKITCVRSHKSLLYDSHVCRITRPLPCLKNSCVATLSMLVSLRNVCEEFVHYIITADNGCSLAPSMKISLKNSAEIVPRVLGSVRELQAARFAAEPDLFCNSHHFVCKAPKLFSFCNSRLNSVMSQELGDHGPAVTPFINLAGTESLQT